MKRNLKRYGILSVICLLPFFIFAQKPKKEEKFGLFLTGNRKFTTIQFQMHANLIIVPVRINDSDTLHFILDTGVSSIIITDPKALKHQKLNMTREVLLAGAGEGQALTASVAIGNTINMGHMKATYQNMVVLKDDVLKLSEFVGVPVHGIFGFDIFNNFVVTIDFVNREIMLEQPNHYKYRPRKGDKYPLIIEETKAYTDMVALVSNGRELPIRMLIDTGAGHALLIDKTPENEIQLPQKVIRAQLGRGLNGVINGNLGRIDKVRFGRHELTNVLASFPDSVSFGVKFRNPAQHTVRQGNIGCELLRRFRVTFNYRDHYMVLKPVRQRLREAFEHDMSGVELRASGTKMQRYHIDRVIENSPAFEAGLEEGDELVFVNNNIASELSISEIYKIFQRGEGKPIELFVRRKDQIHFAKFALKRMI
ncbi:MAG: signal protein PDZ [Runella slithyformis]|nr:MAG: signal protein PDZ [Runella slithyformis]TAF28568.1 MAG: signal protein PDZ [Runella slithyformis]TAF47595.1 MAG: signal protein PDZ [Runella slithyformis]TAF78940.1 MAG: signal protein PDZ [Runella slithyformis]